MELKAGIVCERGLNPKRRVNEDRYLSIPERGLFAVFDGVGGQRAGEIASQTAADTVEEAIRHDSASSPAELIRRAITFANRDIFEMAESNPDFHSMATTVALLHLEDSTATVAHVGDSRVYRLEGGKFFRETVDHTDLNDDIRAGRLTREQAAEHPEKNVINRALGVETEIDVEIKSIGARDGSRFLLCSDGIYRHLSDEELARVLAENKDPQRAADELKRIVLQRGADDNLTAVVVQVGRARQTAVLGIDDGLHPASASTTPVALEAARSSTLRDGNKRISVELDRRSRGQKTEVGRTLDEREDTRSPSRAVMLTLLALVLLAGAFYLGVRTSDWFRRPATQNGALAGDPLQKGVEAFQRDDLQAAASEFDAAVKREPSSAMAHYWLGRVRLEQRDYRGAIQGLEQAISLQPLLFDAYVQAAAAYEASGEHAKATSMLARYGAERRKEQR
jgi:protein phosphatase